MGRVTDSWHMDSTALVASYATGDLSPLDAVAACLERIARLNPAINAVVALSPTAIDDARASTARWAAGKPLSPLEGAPIVIKDNMAVQGMPATWGSTYLADVVPDEDELPIARLRDAGLIIVGKTNVPEFTIEGYTDNALFGTTGNPWNPVLTPGGSSGGSVAAVAAGMVPLALGTDGGGSIRRPAAHTGLVGFKPSIGRIARGRGLPQILLDFEVVGPVGRTVTDVAALFHILDGADRRDHRSRILPAVSAHRGPLRVRYVERFGDAPLDPVIRNSVSSAAAALGDLGYEIDAGPLPVDIAPMDEFWPDLVAVGLAGLAAADPTWRARAGAKYVEMAARGDEVLAERFMAGVEAVSAFRDQVSVAFTDHDIIMTPSCAAMPWQADAPFPTHIDGQEVGPRGHAVYTGWVNACGHPGISLPSASAPDGMPIGFQLIADRGADELLLDIAGRFEAAHPWADRWPEIAGAGYVTD